LPAALSPGTTRPKKEEKLDKKEEGERRRLVVSCELSAERRSRRETGRAVRSRSHISELTEENIGEVKKET